MECKRCLYDTNMDIELDEDGLCDYCKMHDKLEETYPVSDELLTDMFDKIKSDRKGMYDCVMGISGGCDSSYLLHLLIENGLNPLVYHWDNGWNTPIAEFNIDALHSCLDFDLIRIKAKQEYHETNKAFLKASVSEPDIPNDVSLMRIGLELAKRFDIKYIINGHNFRTEGSCPVGWSYIDSEYIETVYEWCFKKPLTNFYLFPYAYQFLSAFSGIKSVRPLYHTSLSKQEMKNVLSDDYGWLDYGGHHCENIFTAFDGSYLLPKKFGIDKRVLGLSAQIRSGIMTKKRAKKILKTPPDYPENYLDQVIDEYFDGNKDKFDKCMNAPIKQFYDYITTKRFTRYKFLFWTFMKLGVFPYTFYKKYTKEVNNILRNRRCRTSVKVKK